MFFDLNYPVLFFVCLFVFLELIKRTRDVSEDVRKASFNVLTKKMDVFSFTPDQRASLIEILSTKR